MNSGDGDFINEYIGFGNEIPSSKALLASVVVSKDSKISIAPASISVAVLIGVATPDIFLLASSWRLVIR